MKRTSRTLLGLLALLVALPLAVRPASGAPARLVLAVGTPLSVAAAQDVDSSSARAGDPVAFVVKKAVVVKGFTLVAAGAAGRGAVVFSRPARVGGRGELMVKVQDVQAVDGTWIRVGVRQGETSGLAGLIPEEQMSLTEPVFPKGKNGLLPAATVLDAWTLGARDFVVTGSKATAAPLPVPPGVKGSKVTVPAGTTLEIRPQADVVTGQVQVGDRVKFVCVETVAVNGQPVVQAGAEAVGTVLRAVESGARNKPGELVVGVDTVATVDGGSLPITSFEGDKGGANRGISFAASRIVPLAGLAISGRQAVLPRDRVCDVATLEDRVVVVPAGTKPAPPLPAPSPAAE